MESLSEPGPRPIVSKTDPARFTAACLDEPRALPETVRRAARQMVCGRARDVDDARTLLEALGLLEPARHSTDRTSSTRPPITPPTAARVSPDAA